MFDDVRPANQGTYPGCIDRNSSNILTQNSRRFPDPCSTFLHREPNQLTRTQMKLELKRLAPQIALSTAATIFLAWLGLIAWYKPMVNGDTMALIGWTENALNYIQAGTPKEWVLSKALRIRFILKNFSWAICGGLLLLTCIAIGLREKNSDVPARTS